MYLTFVIAVYNFYKAILTNVNLFVYICFKCLI
jgi:hypothetical protein